MPTRNVNLEWPAVPNADGYEIEVFRLETPPVMEDTIENLTYTELETCYAASIGFDYRFDIYSTQQAGIVRSSGCSSVTINVSGTLQPPGSITATLG